MNSVKSFFQSTSLSEVAAYIVKYGGKFLVGLLIFSPLLITLTQVYTSLLPGVYPPLPVETGLEIILAAFWVLSMFELVGLGVVLLIFLGKGFRVLLEWADKKIQN